MREGRREAPSDLPLAQRVAALEDGDGAGRRTRTGGNNELVFDPSSRGVRGVLTVRIRPQDVRQFVAVAARITFARTLQFTDLLDDVFRKLADSL